MGKTITSIFFAVLALGMWAGNAFASTSFASLDNNNDGRISRAEWQSTSSTFKQADKNRDGVVSESEYFRWVDANNDRSGDNRYSDIDSRYDNDRHYANDRRYSDDDEDYGRDRYYRRNSDVNYPNYAANPVYVVPSNYNPGYNNYGYGAGYPYATGYSPYGAYSPYNSLPQTLLGSLGGLGGLGMNGLGYAPGVSKSAVRTSAAINMVGSLLNGFMMMR